MENGRELKFAHSTVDDFLVTYDHSCIFGRHKMAIVDQVDKILTFNTSSAYTPVDPLVAP